MTTSTTTNSLIFENLVEAHSREIYLYLWRLTRNELDAEDCLQECFLRAYKSFSRLKNHDNLRAWLYKIATNVANTHLKKHTKTSNHLSDQDFHRIPSDQNLHNEVELSLSLQQVADAVRSLPAKQRSALIMHKFQHLKYPEIAEALNISQDSARANVYQAMKKLRQEFIQPEKV